MTKFIARWRNGRELIFRPLTWAEYRRFEQEALYRPEMSVYCDIYRAAVLQGPALGVLQAPSATDASAGLVEFVGRTLFDESVFSGRYADVKQALEIKRTALQSNYLLAARAVIGSLFHKTDEEMDAWDADTFFDYVARAEFISGRPFEPGDPNASKKPVRPVRTNGDPSPSRNADVVEAATFTRDRPPTPPPDDPAPRLRRPLTAAQQVVVDRVRRQS